MTRRESLIRKTKEELEEEERLEKERIKIAMVRRNAARRKKKGRA